MPSISTTIPDNVKIYRTLDEFDRHLPDTVRLLHTDNGSRVYLIGTAHFSAKSHDDVSLVMQNVRPDKLVLELCSQRLHILYFDEERLLRESADMSYAKVRDIYMQHGLVGGMFYLKFLSINADVTRQLGIAPGGECRRGLAEAKRLGDCQVLLGDRSINVTMQRAIRGMSLLDKLKMSVLYAFMPSTAPITQHDVEVLKSRTAAYLKDPAGSAAPPDDRHTMPSLHNAFVHERDLLLCHSLHYAANADESHGKAFGPAVKVVGIVGIGHSPGIVENWRHRLSAGELAELLSVPPERLSQRLVRVSFRFGVLALCGYGVYRAFGMPKTGDRRRRPTDDDG